MDTDGVMRAVIPVHKGQRVAFVNLREAAQHALNDLAAKHGGKATPARYVTVVWGPVFGLPGRPPMKQYIFEASLYGHDRLP